MATPAHESSGDEYEDEYDDEVGNEDADDDEEPQQGRGDSTDEEFESTGFGDFADTTDDDEEEDEDEDGDDDETGDDEEYETDDDDEEEGEEKSEDEEEESDEDDEEDGEKDPLVTNLTNETIPEDEEEDSDEAEDDPVVQSKEGASNEDLATICVCAVCCCIILAGIGVALYFLVFRKDKSNDENKLEVVPTVAPNAVVPTPSPGNETTQAPFPTPLPTTKPPARAFPKPTSSESLPATPSTPPPTLAFQNIIQIPVSADTSLRDGEFSSGTFGTSEVLLVRNDPNTFSSRTLLLFNLGTHPIADNLFGLPTATLTLEHVASVAGSASNITVTALPSYPLAIENLSWEKYQQTSGTEGPTFQVSPSESTVRVDVTELALAGQRRRLHLRRVQDNNTNELLLLLEAKEPGIDESGVEFRSREYLNGEYAPQLLLSYPTPSPIPAPAGHSNVTVPSATGPSDDDGDDDGNADDSDEDCVPYPLGNGTMVLNGTMPINGTLPGNGTRYCPEGSTDDSSDDMPTGGHNSTDAHPGDNVTAVHAGNGTDAHMGGNGTDMHGGGGNGTHIHHGGNGTDTHHGGNVTNTPGSGNSTAGNSTAGNSTAGNSTAGNSTGMHIGGNATDTQEDGNATATNGANATQARRYLEEEMEVVFRRRLDPATMSDPAHSRN